MKKIFTLVALIAATTLFVSCNKNKSELYGIAHGEYTYAGIGSGTDAGMAVLDYVNSFDRTFMIEGDGENERNNKAKSSFSTYMAPFTQARFQEKLEESLGENAKGQATVKYYLYRAGSDNEDIKYIDSTELYTATKN